MMTNDAGETAEIVHEPRLATSAFPMLRRAAIDGLGIAFLPEYACRELLDAGDLVHVLPDWSLGEGILHLVFTSRRGQLPAVRAAIDFLGQVLKPSSPAWQDEDAVRL
jgi:DNA-binding transcriptional LysR family regulator